MFFEFEISVSHKNVLISLDEICTITEDIEGSTIELKNGNFYHVHNEYKDIYKSLNDL